MERSMLDFAIHISFMFLEISLYERIIKGQDERKTKEETEVLLYGRSLEEQENIWRGIILDEWALKYLGKMKELKDLQSSYSN